PHGQAPKAWFFRGGPQRAKEGLLAPHRLDVVGGLAIHPGRAGTLVAPHPTPPNQQERRVTHEVVQITKPTGPILGCPSVQLGLDPQYPRLRLRTGERPPPRARSHPRAPTPPCPIPPEAHS